MVTTPYNFKQWFKRHYPDITINPVYGLEAYTFDKPLLPTDMFEYNVQQLPNGLYIIFVGRSPEQIVDLMRNINENGLQYIRPQRKIPTTFASFENWLRNNQIKPLYRTHIARQTAAEALHTKSDDAQMNQRRDWYMYELNGTVDLSSFTGPTLKTENGTIVVLIKASTNTYVSKKQLFRERFALMQPVFEQLVAACATGEWDKATDLCEHYMGIQFDCEGTVELEQLKQAYERGELSLFTRIRSNLKEVSDGSDN